jgi:hypothetical protein
MAPHVRQMGSTQSIQLVDQFIGNPADHCLLPPLVRVAGCHPRSVGHLLCQKAKLPSRHHKGIVVAVGVVALQITLGVWTILSYVNITIALIHQANAIVLLGLAVYFIHRFRALDEA